MGPKNKIVNLDLRTHYNQCALCKIITDLSSSAEQKGNSFALTLGISTLIQFQKVCIAVNEYNEGKFLLTELNYAKRRLYESMIMSNLTKVYIVFKTSFWLKDGFSGEVVSNGGPSHVESCEKVT